MSFTSLEKLEKAEEAYSLSCSTKGTFPIDTWKDEKHWRPKELTVLGWDADKIFKCHYDCEKRRWLNTKEEHVRVYMWRRQ